MAQINTQKILKIISFILINTAIAFCLTMVIILGIYMQQRIDTCYAVGYTDCGHRISVYTYGPPFRNVTMKFIVDIITQSILAIAGIAMVFCLQKTPKIVNAIILVCLLALTLMSLGCTIKSIDQEDEENVQAFTVKIPELETSIPAGETALAGLQANLATLQAQYDAAANTAATSSNPTAVGTAQATMAGLSPNIAKLKAGISTYQTKLAAGHRAYNALTTLKSDYYRYRDSALALELVTFSLIYTFILLKVFYQLYLYLQAKDMASHYSQAIQLPNIDPLIKGQSNVTDNLEHIELKGKSSSESEAVGFSTHV